MSGDFRESDGAHRPAADSGGRDDGARDGVHQMVFRWDGNQGRQGTGMTAVAHSCSAERAEQLGRELGPLLWVSGASQPRRSFVRTVTGDGEILLVQRWPTTDRAGRPSTVSHVLAGPASILKTRLCLGLAHGGWGTRASVEKHTGTMRMVGAEQLWDLARERLPKMEALFKEVPRALTDVTAEWLRDPAQRISLRMDGKPLADGSDQEPVVFLGLFLLFGDWLRHDWTFATHDTTDTHPLRLMSVPRWEPDTGGSGPLARVAADGRPDAQFEHKAAFQLVTHLLANPGRAPGVPQLTDRLADGAALGWEQRSRLLHEILAAEGGTGARAALPDPEPRRSSSDRQPSRSGWEPQHRGWEPSQSNWEPAHRDWQPSQSGWEPGSGQPQPTGAGAAAPPGTPAHPPTPPRPAEAPAHPGLDLSTPVRPTADQATTGYPGADDAAPGYPVDARSAPASAAADHSAAGRSVTGWSETGTGADRPATPVDLALHDDLRDHWRRHSGEHDRLAGRLRDLDDEALLRALSLPGLPLAATELLLDELGRECRLDVREPAMRHRLCAEVLGRSCYFTTDEQYRRGFTGHAVAELASAAFGWAVAPLAREECYLRELRELVYLMSRDTNSAGDAWLRQSITEAARAPDLPPELWQEILRAKHKSAPATVVRTAPMPAPAPPSPPHPADTERRRSVGSWILDLLDKPSCVVVAALAVIVMLIIAILQYS